MEKQADSELTALRIAYSQNLLIPVIGSGVSMPFHLPDWSSLLREAAKYFSLRADMCVRMENALISWDYLGAADAIIDAGVQEQELQSFVAKLMKEAKKNASLPESHNYDDLARLERSRFMTTNYDEYLNDFVSSKVLHLEDLEQLEVNELPFPKYNQTVIPIHGEISKPESIVLSRASYKKLYEFSQFEKEFQYLRQGFTFLFIGFSFNDEYVQGMFKKLSSRLKAKHYILFAETQKGNKQKIDELREKYSIYPLFYRVMDGKHSDGIREVLEKILHFSDESIDISEFEVLSSDHEKKNAEYYRKQGYEYGRILNFEKAEIQLKRAWNLCKEEDVAISYGECLINLYKWDEALAVLEKCEKKSRLVELLEAISRLNKKYLADAERINGKIPVYGKAPWSAEICRKRNMEYEAFKNHFVNPMTMNLLEMNSYHRREQQEAAYYWLAITAGQLFHQHEDALQFCYRAYEIRKSEPLLEELAHNYYAVGTANIRYKKNAEYSELVKHQLMKAKECMELALATDDIKMRRSIYRHSGYMYLELLNLLHYDMEFKRIYPKVARYYQHEPMLFKMKAEHSARFEYIIDYKALRKLPECDRIFVRALRYQSLADLYQRQGRGKQAKEYADKCLCKLREYRGYQQDKQFMLLLMDMLFFYKEDLTEISRNLEVFEKNFEIVPTYRAFWMEKNGHYEDAEELLYREFIDTPDVSTFVILRGIMLRHNELGKVLALYEYVEAHYMDIIYDTSDFYSAWILTVINQRADNSSDDALSLYAKYWKQITNLEQLAEVEEALKPYARDFGDYQERIECLKKWMSEGPRQTAFQFVADVVRLYLANYKLDEAKKFLQEYNLNPDQMFYNSNLPGLMKIQEVLRNAQPREFYTHNNKCKPRFSRNTMRNVLNRLNQYPMYQQQFWGRKGQRIFLPVSMVLVMLYEDRIDELEAMDTIYLAYGGITWLTNGMLYEEDWLLRSANYWISESENVKLTAPTLSGYCHWKDKLPTGTSPERIQLEAYCEENSIKAMFSELC